MATKAEKAYDTRLFKAARTMAQQLSVLSPNAVDAVVAAAVISVPGSRSLLREAFLLLDREPHRFVGNEVWHSMVRRLRNTPDALAKTELFHD